jgi:GNAT superfamily N-acetyltransferase
MVFADVVLARRIEAAEGAIGRACAEQQAGSMTLEVGGGTALFLGPESPLTHAVGVGLNGPVRDTEIDALEAFFRSRGARVSIELCPLADAGLLTSLGERGYRPYEFNNVLVKPLEGSEGSLTPRVRCATETEKDLWSHTVGQGFFEQPELTEEEMNVGRAIFGMPGAVCYLALLEGGEAAAGAALSVGNRLATLFADGTIPQLRRRGLHQELIAARLNEARAQGCDLAAASTVPGSASQRNYERLGFRVVYTKITLVG